MFGYTGTRQEVLWICDRCECTFLGTKGEISQLKWKSYAQGKLLLCPDCQPKVTK